MVCPVPSRLVPSSSSYRYRSLFSSCVRVLLSFYSTIPRCPKPLFLLLSWRAASFEYRPQNQAAAVLGIALVTLGDDIGSEMALRTFDHLLHYGELPIRR